MIAPLLARHDALPLLPTDKETVAFANVLVVLGERASRLLIEPVKRGQGQYVSETVLDQVKGYMRAQRREVVPANSSFSPVPSGLLQRKCACGNHTMVVGECAECSKKEAIEQALVGSRKAVGAGLTAGHGAVSGYDFSRLRVLRRGYRAIGAGGERQCLPVMTQECVGCGSIPPGDA